MTSHEGTAALNDLINQNNQLDELVLEFLKKMEGCGKLFGQHAEANDEAGQLMTGIKCRLKSLVDTVSKGKALITTFGWGPPLLEEDIEGISSLGNELAQFLDKDATDSSNSDVRAFVIASAGIHRLGERIQHSMEEVSEAVKKAGIKIGSDSGKGQYMALPMGPSQDQQMIFVDVKKHAAGEAVPLVLWISGKGLRNRELYAHLIRRVISADIPPGDAFTRSLAERASNVSRVLEQSKGLMTDESLGQADSDSVSVATRDLDRYQKSECSSLAIGFSCSQHFIEDRRKKSNRHTFRPLSLLLPQGDPIPSTKVSEPNDAARVMQQLLGNRRKRPGSKPWLPFRSGRESLRDHYQAMAELTQATQLAASLTGSSTADVENKSSFTAASTRFVFQKEGGEGPQAQTKETVTCP